MTQATDNLPTPAQLRRYAIDATTSYSAYVAEAFRAGLTQNAGGTHTKTNAHDLVTETDKAVERGLREHLAHSIAKHHGAHGVHARFWGEEFGRDTDTDTDGAVTVEWIIDPIDGTSNFVHGFETFSISVAAAFRGEVVAGVVHDPINQLVYSADDTGAYLNDQLLGTTGAEVMCRPAPDSPRSYNLVTSFPAAEIVENHSPAIRSQALDVFGQMVSEFATVRRVVSGALELCFAATGRADVVLGFATKPWDIAAAQLILRRAGGQFLTADADQPHLTAHYAGVAPGRSTDAAQKYLDALIDVDARTQAL